MTRCRILLSFLILCAIAVGCREEQKFSAPLVQTGTQFQVTEQGVLLTGRVAEAGTGAGTVGFVWSIDTTPTLENALRFETVEFTKGPIEAFVNYDLDSGVTYFIRAFGRNGNSVVYGQTETFTSLGCPGPVITNQNPSSGTRGSEVELSGSGFSPVLSRNKVKLGSSEVEVLTCSPTRLTVRIPSWFPYSGFLSWSIKVSSRSFVYSGLFTVDGAAITELVPAQASAGDTVIIKGSNFSPVVANNTVTYGTYPIAAISGSSTELRIKLPYDFTTGSSKVGVRVNGIITYSMQPLIVVNKWSKVFPSGDLPGSRQNAIGISVAGDGFYFGVGEYNYNYTFSPTYCRQFWKYSFSSGQWARYPDFPATNQWRAACGFEVSGKIFVGLGDNGLGPGITSKEFWMYDPGSVSWTRKNDFPGQARVVPVSCVINGTAYVGMGVNSVSLTDFYKYDANLDAWTRLADFPGTGFVGRLFSIGGKAYACSGKQLWRFDPLANSWVQLSDLPGMLYNPSVVVAGTVAYLAGGEQPGPVIVDEFWEFRPSTGLWIRRPDLPTSGMNNAVGFTLNGKIYLYSGYSMESGIWSPLESFLIYNPNP